MKGGGIGALEQTLKERLGFAATVLQLVPYLIRQGKWREVVMAFRIALTRKGDIILDLVEKAGFNELSSSASTVK